MCGGAGCHAGMFVHERLWGHEGPKLEGWWGTKDQERFFMKKKIEPALGADSFRVSHPSVWAVITVLAALEVNLLFPFFLLNFAICFYIFVFILIIQFFKHLFNL